MDHVTIDHLRQMLIENCMVKVAPETIQEDTPLFGPDSLGLDSLDAMQMVVAVEKEFHVVIGDPASARDALQSLGVLKDFLEKKFASRTGPEPHACPSGN
jgi:acyl carrier protein